jgi:hypothetical protein
MRFLSMRHQMSYGEIFDQVHRLLANAPKQAKVFLWRYFGDDRGRVLSYDDIAERLEIRPGTVACHLHRAKEKLDVAWPEWPRLLAEHHRQADLEYRSVTPQQRLCTIPLDRNFEPQTITDWTAERAINSDGHAPPPDD